LTWTVEFQEQAIEDLEQLDKPVQRRILRYFSERIENSNDPKQFGKPLTGDKKGLWRYRIGDYRAICVMGDHKLIVLVLAVGHRRKVYQ
jgi:mRNA interferase RelE/StbE